MSKSAFLLLAIIAIGVVAALVLLNSTAGRHELLPDPANRESYLQSAEPGDDENENDTVSASHSVSTEGPSDDHGSTDGADSKASRELDGESESSGGGDHPFRLDSNIDALRRTARSLRGPIEELVTNSLINPNGKKLSGQEISELSEMFAGDLAVVRDLNERLRTEMRSAANRLYDAGRAERLDPVGPSHEQWNEEHPVYVTPDADEGERVFTVTRAGKEPHIVRIRLGVDSGVDDVMTALEQRLESTVNAMRQAINDM